MRFTFRDALNSVFRYSRALVAFWAVVLIATLVFYSQTKKLYDSKAKILISLGTEALGKADYLSGKNIQFLQREQQLHNEQQILESHEVMMMTAKWVLGDLTPGSSAPITDARQQEARQFLTSQDPAPTFLLGVMRMAVQAFGSTLGNPPTHAEQLEGIAQELSSDLSVKAIFDSDALDVSFRYRNPRVAQTVLQMLIDAYLRHHIVVFQSNAESDLLKSQLDHSVNMYHDRLGDFSSFMAAHRVYNDDSQVSALVEQREKLRQSLNEALADSDAASARLASLTSIRASLHELEHYSTTEVRNKERDALLAKLDDASVEERTLLTRHPKESRAYEEEQSKLDEIRRLLEQEPERVVQETEQRKSQASEFVESEVINVTEAQHGVQARIERLRNDLQDMDSEIKKYTTDLKGFNSLKLDLTFAKQESEQMAQVYVDSRLKTLTAQNAITDISIIDPPTWDPNPASPSKKLTIAAVLLLLMMGSFAVWFACISLDTTMADGATAERRLGFPVVGTIPVTRGAANSRSFLDFFTQQNQREFARIYQSVRGRGPLGKIILIAESNSGEGASLIGYGLTRFLNGYASEKTVFIDRTVNPVTESLSIGDRTANEPAALAWANAELGATGGSGKDAISVLSKLRQDVAYVVVSAGAAKDATDLLTTSGIVSAVFFIIEAGKTRSWAARYNLDLLQRYGFDGIQLILNKRIFYIPRWLMRFA